MTNFFRDPEAFRVLEEQVIPAILAGKPADAQIRAWLAGCSTGEKAYSLAILLAEHEAATKLHFAIHVSTTDIYPRAIASARAGILPASIAADVSAERLRRFFTVEAGGESYRIGKSMRDMLIFSEHDLIKDPPFSKLDLISCRNVRIYMGAELQKRLFPLFHYSLNPGGVLMHGTAEMVGDYDDSFATVDGKSKVDRCQSVQQT